VPESIEIVGAIESIPPLPADWVQRAALERLRDQLVHERRVVVYGLPGVGKTTLAATLADELSATSPVFWLTFTEGLTTSVESLIRQLALFTLTLGRDTAVPLLTPRDLHTRPLPLEEQVALLNQALAGQECLLCFDHLYLVYQNPFLLQVLQHLAATTQAHLLLIGREETTLTGFTPLHVKGLEYQETVELVMRLGVTLLPGQIEQLFLKTAGNPMLLRLAVAQLREARTAAELSAFIARLETAPQVSAYLLETVLRPLSEPAWRLIELLSIVRSPIDLTDERLIERSHTIIGHEAQRWGEAVAELQQRHLVEHPRTTILHSLLRDYIYTRLGNEPERRRELHRLVAEWLAETPDEALQAAYHYGRAQEFKRAVELLTDQAETVFDLAQTEVALPLIDELLGQARRWSPTDWLRALLTLRGDLLTRTTRTAEAEANYHEALALTNEQAVRAHIAVRLAQNLLLRQRAAEVLALCDTAVKGLSLPKYPLLHAQIAVIKCQAHLTLSQFDEAAAAAEQARQQARRITLIAPLQTLQLQTQIHLALGALAGIHGELQAAQEQWQEAITTARVTGSKSLEYRAHTNMGITLYQKGDFPNALEHYQIALFGAQSFADSILAARVLSNMAILHHLCGQFDTALAEAEQARQLRVQLGDRLGVANLDNTRASILLAQHRFAGAHTIAENVVREAESLHHLRLLGSALDTLAQIHLAQGDGKAAEASLKRALELPSAQQDTSLSGDLRCHLALVQLVDGEVDAAKHTLVGLPEDESPRAAIERAILGGWLALAQQETATAYEHLALAQTRIETSGCRLYQHAVERLAEASTGNQTYDLRLALL
jgi:ATP/maltotriose-dependent transcriptional regulator MalT